MASTHALLCAIVVLACVAVSTAAAPVAASSPLWPQPASASFGTSVVQLAPAFAFVTAAKSDLLGRAIARYTALLAVPRSAAASTSSQLAAPPLLASCTILVETVLATAAAERASLRLEKMNETYALTVAADASACTIHANTIWGALRGLETFVQLFTRDTSAGAKSAGAVTTALAPVAIADSPRFAHRGLLIDTARHFLPVATIQVRGSDEPMNRHHK
jgi:hexosaminidase